MIKSFRDKDTESLFAGRCPGRFKAFGSQAERKLKMLDTASSLIDLRSPPGNRLEALKGDRRGQWSIRINDRWRLCFRWAQNEARDVQVVDYH